jgi:hypothetical protein
MSGTLNFCHAAIEGLTLVEAVKLTLSLNRNSLGIVNKHTQDLAVPIYSSIYCPHPERRQLTRHISSKIGK